MRIHCSRLVAAVALLRIVSTQSTRPPSDPTKYEVLCAHQSAINRACLGGGKTKATQMGGAIRPQRSRKYPSEPAMAANSAITNKSPDIGRTSSTALIFLH